MSSADRWDEKHAEQIVGEKTGGLAHTRDVPGAPPGTHDFDVVLPDGRILAVEATPHADPEQFRLYAAIRQYGEWIFPELTCSWYLILDPVATRYATSMQKPERCYRAIRACWLTWRASGRVPKAVFTSFAFVASGNCRRFTLLTSSASLTTSMLEIWTPRWTDDHRGHRAAGQPQSRQTRPGRRR